MMSNGVGSRIVLVLVSMVTLSSFNNCAGQSGSVTGRTGPLPIDHPPEERVFKIQQDLLLGNQTYIASVMREVFSSSNLSSEGRRRLETILLDKVTANRANFGGACDLMDPGTTSDFNAACGNSKDNAGLPFHTSSTTAREAWRIQVCGLLTSDDEILNSAVAKVKNSSAPDFDAIANIVDLFYPAETELDAVTSGLNRLEAAMRSRGETAQNRWRLLFYAVCETPYWQIL